MQELTGQYSQLYTRKFRVSYTDFQPEATARGKKLLFSLADGNQIVMCMIVPAIQGVCAGATSLALRVIQGPYSNSVGNTSGQLIQYSALSPVLADSGVIQSVVPRTNSVTPPTHSSICFKGQPTEIYAILDVVGGPTVNSVSAGSWYIYVTSIRLV